MDTGNQGQAETRAKGNTRGPRWKGPPGLSAKEKAAWSEQQRRDKLTAPEKRRLQIERDIREERAKLRDIDRREFLHVEMRMELSIVRKRSLARPPLSFIDPAGRVHREDFRSAEELIRAWKQSQKRKDTKCAEKQSTPKPHASSSAATSGKTTHKSESNETPPYGGQSSGAS